MEDWKEKAIEWLSLEIANQATANARWPKHAVAYPSWTERITHMELLISRLERNL